MNKRILIVDDGEFFRQTLRDILTRAGYEVAGEAENGVEALEKVHTLKPDCVILDVVMPLKNGLDAAKEISMLGLPLKIIMCTSLGYDSVVDEAITSGASGYILKPLNESRVLEVLENTLDTGG